MKSNEVTPVNHPSKSGNPFITLDDVTLRVDGKLLFEHTSWVIQSDQHWAIIGPNGSGKSTLANAICRRVTVVRGRILYFFERDSGNAYKARPYLNRGEIAIISPDAHRELMHQYSGYHQARWQSIEGKDAPTVSDLLTGKSIEHISPYDVTPLNVSERVYQVRRRHAVELLGIAYLLGRKILHISHGEARKVLIAHVLMQSPKLLILDDPFGGLDNSSRDALKRTIEELLAAGSPQILLVTPRLEEIPQGITHVLCVAGNRVIDQGAKGEILRTEFVQTLFASGKKSSSPNPLTGMGFDPSMSPKATDSPPGRGKGWVSESDEVPDRVTHPQPLPGGEFTASPGESRYLSAPNPTHQGREIAQEACQENPISPVGRAGGGGTTILIEMRNTSVSYGGTDVLRGITWTMRQGERWAVLGPNGAGKTTLLSLILADNPQSYANEISIFGKQRGSGESIWDIKRNIGWVSPELQIYYHSGITCHKVVCSGFFDSVGLYQACSSEQAWIATQWMRSFGIAELVDCPLSTVSVGEQRLVLLARALVKNPILLILDEPCQGLDVSHRTHIIHLLDQLGRQTPVSLIYVTHHFDEMPNVITHVLKLDRGQIQESGTRKSVLGW
jgi:ABC-type molybdenum transport system ATPase subunit/photorepair protein PhrA